MYTFYSTIVKQRKGYDFSSLCKQVSLFIYPRSSETTFLTNEIPYVSSEKSQIGTGFYIKSLNFINSNSRRFF